MRPPSPTADELALDAAALQAERAKYRSMIDRASEAGRCSEAQHARDDARQAAYERDYRDLPERAATLQDAWNAPEAVAERQANRDLANAAIDKGMAPARARQATRWAGEDAAKPEQREAA